MKEKNNYRFRISIYFIKLERLSHQKGTRERSIDSFLEFLFLSIYNLSFKNHANYLLKLHATQDRAELQNMLNDLREGDTIYVTDLTRITRGTRDLFELVDYIKNKKANLKSLKDTWLDLSEENPYRGNASVHTTRGKVNYEHC